MQDESVYNNFSYHKLERKTCRVDASLSSFPWKVQHAMELTLDHCFPPLWVPTSQVIKATGVLWQGQIAMDCFFFLWFEFESWTLKKHSLVSSLSLTWTRWVTRWPRMSPSPPTPTWAASARQGESPLTIPQPGHGWDFNHQRVGWWLLRLPISSHGFAESSWIFFRTATSWSTMSSPPQEHLHGWSFRVNCGWVLAGKVSRSRCISMYFPILSFQKRPPLSASMFLRFCPGREGVHPAGHEPRLRLLRLCLLLLHCSAQLRAEEDAWTNLDLDRKLKERSQQGSRKAWSAMDHRGTIMGSKVSCYQPVGGWILEMLWRGPLFTCFLLLGFCWGSSSRRSSWLRASEQFHHVIFYIVEFRWADGSAAAMTWQYCDSSNAEVQSSISNFKTSEGQKVMALSSSMEYLSTLFSIAHSPSASWPKPKNWQRLAMRRWDEGL